MSSNFGKEAVKMLSVFKLTKSSHLGGLSYVVPYTGRPRPLQRSGNWVIYLFGHDSYPNYCAYHSPLVSGP